MADLTTRPDSINYGVAIPWPLLKRHIEQKVRELTSELRGAKNLEALYKAQGALDFAEKLLNLPGTLTILESVETT